MPFNKIVGLDFGSSSIRAVEVELNKDGSIKEVEKVAQVRIPTQVIANGTVVDEKSLIAALRELISRNDIKTKDVALSINGSSIITRNLKHVEAEKDEKIFLKILPIKLKDAIPMDLSEYYIGSHTTTEYLDEKENKLYRDILIAALLKENVDKILKAVHEVGLRPHVIDTAPLGIMRTTLAGLSEEEKAISDYRLASIDVGADVTNIIIHRNGIPEYIRTITGLGGNIANSRISTELHIPASEAEREKFKALTKANSIAQKNTSVFGVNDIQGIDPGTDEALLARAINVIVAQEVSVLVQQIRDTFNDALFHGEVVDGPIEKIELSGAGSGIGTLASRLNNELEIPVAYINPFRNHMNKQLAKQIESGEIFPHEFATAFGIVNREIW